MGIDLLLQAELAAKRFSQIRLFIPKRSIDLSKYTGYAIEWPRSALKKLPSPAKLKKLGLKLDSFFRSIDYYGYTHTDYKEMKTENNKLDYIRFKILRNYFSIKRLESIPSEHISNLKIRIGYRETILPKENLNTNNIELINDLRMIEDIEWFFNIQSTEYKFSLRMPCYFGPFIFIEKGLFPNMQLIPVYRPSHGSQRDKDKRSISNRFVIASEDRLSYNHIADFSYGSLLQLIDDKQLHTRCEEIVYEFEQEKVGF